ncbi:MAG TPA: hypothetical protein VN033_00185 [Vulgatibacter sp.]|nr:hypothetical protein [Vulgatibacter sp.]
MATRKVPPTDTGDKPTGEDVFLAALGWGLKGLRQDLKLLALEHFRELNAAREWLRRLNDLDETRAGLGEADSFKTWMLDVLALRGLTVAEAGDLLGSNGREYLRHGLGKRRIPASYARDFGRALRVEIPADLVEPDR